MATSFPSGLDSFTNPTAVDTLDSPPHDTQHADANDAIEALQAKVGVDSSAVTSSLDYRVGQLETGGGGMTVSSTAPSSPAEGDMWYDDTSGRTYVYYDDGSSQQWVEFGAPPSGIGKILQVVQATKTSYFGTTSTSFVDTGLAVTITPSDTSSQILIFASVPVRLANSLARTIDTIYRGSAASGTNLGGGSYNGLTVPYSATNIASFSIQNTFHVLDSPSTTSATTYNHAAKTTSASNGYNLMADEAMAVITAIEVGA
jgi:hypothetical protein